MVGFIFALGLGWAFNWGVQGGHWAGVGLLFSYDFPSVSYGEKISRARKWPDYKVEFMYIGSQFSSDSFVRRECAAPIER